MSTATPTPTPTSGLTLTVNSDGDLPDVSPGNGTCQAGAGPGDCTLRAAIEEANAYPGFDHVVFSIGGGGVQTIAPSSALPTITEAVTIDGTTQPGFADTPIIELNGTSASANGLYIIGPGSTVRGLVINRFAGEGILIEGPDATGNVIQGNFIGTNVYGTAESGNMSSGVYLRYAQETTVGGTAPGEGNLISGNSGWSGVAICGNSSFCGGGALGTLSTGAAGNAVLGNRIGTDVTGTIAIGNHQRGVTVDGAASSLIKANVIAGSAFQGLELSTAESTGNGVFSNYIGVNTSGAPLPNGGAGVILSGGAHDNAIGAPTVGNTIANNVGTGILVDGAATTGNRISANSIYANGVLGIANTNGGNVELAPPVILSAGAGGVTGTACNGCLVEVFSDDAGQGRVFHGSVAADPVDGSWMFAAAPVGPNVTTTATDTAGNTSQFSAPFAVAATVSGLTLSVAESSIPAGASAVPIKNIPIEKIPPSSAIPAAALRNVDLQSSPLSSIPLSSIPLSSIALGASPLSSIPLSSIPISKAGGWEAILATTSLVGVPVQSVTLEQLLRAAPAALDSLTLADVGLSQSPLSSIGLASIALGALPLSSISLPGGSGDPLTDWCAVLATAGFTCASLGVDGGNIGSTTLLALNLKGVPLSSIPLSSIPLSSIPLSSIPLSSIPLSSIPLSSIPLSSIPLSSIPLSSIPLSSIPLSSIPLSSISVPGGDFCAWFASPATTCGALGITNTASLDALMTALTSAAVGPSSTPLSSIPLSSIPLSSILLSSIPLSSILLRGVPLSSISVPGGFCAYFDAGLQAEKCVDLGIGDTSTLEQLLMALQLNGTDPVSTPLSSIPLSSIPLSSIPLSSIPLSSIPLSSIPLSSIPLSSIAIAGTPLSSIPLSSIPLSSIPLSSIPLSSIPLSSIGLVVDCTVVDCSSGTLGDAAGAGKIRPGATLGELGIYSTTTVEHLLTAMGIGPDQVSFFLSFFYGDLLVGQANGADVNLGDLTLGQILMALLIRSDYPWESLPLEAMGVQDFAGSAASLHYHVSFGYGGAGGPAVSISVDLPVGFRYVSGSSSISVVSGGPLPIGYAMMIPDPAITGSRLLWQFPSGFAAGDSVGLDFMARPGLDLGTFASSASVMMGEDSTSVANQAPVQVTENFEPNGDPATAPIIAPDTLYISHISSGSDDDYFRIAAPSVAGARISVYLSHQSTDGDLLLYRPGAAPLRPSTGMPVQKAPLDDAPPEAVGSTAAPPETLQDIPLSSIPLSSISASRGVTSESVAALSLNSAGFYTIQVSGYNGSFSDKPYVLRVKVTPPPPVPQCAARSFAHAGEGVPGAIPGNIPANVNTLFLVNQKRLGDAYGAAEATSVMASLSTLAGRADLGVIGAVIPVEGDAAVQAAYDAWDANPCSPQGANDVVAAINALIDGIRPGLTQLQYIVVVGSDEVMPMGRIPDMTRVANESSYSGDVQQINGNNAIFGSLVTSNILSDDPYGDFDPIPWLNRQRFVPDVAVGRLIETPQDINSQVNQFIAANGALDPTTALSTGYDFLSDGGNAVADALDQLIAPSLTDRLISDSWTRTDLSDRLTGATPPAVAAINSHFDHYRALPAAGNTTGDESDLFTTADVASANLANRIIFSMGCHSGLNVANVLVTLPGPEQSKRLLDWPEAFSRRGAAAYVGNTGYGYGDTDIVAYSEQLMQLFAQRLDGSMAIGQALTFAKQDYFGRLVQYEAYDEKVMAEATFYGLPMFRIGAGGAPVPAATATPAMSVDPVTGLDSVQITSAPAFSRVNVPGRGGYDTADGNAEVTSGHPIQPVLRFDLPVGPNGAVAHGVVLTGLQSTDEANFDAVFSQPAIDVSTSEKPVDDVFPSAIQNLTTFNTPAGQRQRLTLMPGQYFPDPSAPVGVGIERRYTSVAALVFYSSSGDFTPPTILETRAALVNSDAAFSVDVRDNVADDIRRVLVLFRDESGGQWKRVELSPSPGTDRWTGAAAAIGQLEYMAFAVDAAGNVATTTNKGELHHAVTQPAPGDGLTLTVSGDVAANGWFRTANVTVSGGQDVLFDVSVDGGAFQRYDGPLSITGAGVHFVDVLGSDRSQGGAIVPVDDTPPTIAILTPANGATYTVGQAVLADYGCSDAGSGIASCSGPVASGAALDTSTPGTRTFQVTASDVAGNSHSVTHTYNVVRYAFTGFFSPVNNLPVLNVTTAGSSVPVKWRIQDAQGAYIRSLSAVTALQSQAIACSSGVPQDTLEETLTAGASGLQYSLTDEQYVYAWKTPKLWKGTCRRFTVSLADGTKYSADFKLK